MIISKIHSEKGYTPSQVAFALTKAIERSRFRANVLLVERGKMKVLDVRLRQKKPYCGNHPNACELGRQEKRASYLEGADWVEFDDLINDVLDNLYVSADVESNVCILRKGARRRLHYSSYVAHTLGSGARVWQWRKDEPPAYYGDYRGKGAPRSEFPDGTPGIHVGTGYAEE